MTRYLTAADGRIRGASGTCPNCGVLTRRRTRDNRKDFRDGTLRPDVGYGWCRNCKESTEQELDDFLADYDPTPKVRALSANVEEPGAHFMATPLPSFFADAPCGTGVAADYNDNQAKMDCRLCPFWFDCLEWALENPEVTGSGVYGGMTASERRSYLSRRRAVAEGEITHEELGDVLVLPTARGAA